MNKLIITGNGFDLMHGLKTRYINFKEYLMENGESEIVSVIDENISVNKDPEWNCFEKSLGIDHSYSLEKINSIYNAKSKIRELMRNWILSININGLVPVLPLDLIGKENSYLTFNYTDTLKIYDVPESQICHIHGKTKDTSKELIFGHENSTTNLLDVSGNNPYLHECEMKIAWSNLHTRKYVHHNIRQNKNFFESLTDIKQVVVLGHSLSEVDYPYFVEIQRDVPSVCDWYISYYDAKDKYNKQAEIRKLRLNNVQLFKMDNGINEEDVERILSSQRT